MNNDTPTVFEQGSYREAAVNSNVRVVEF